MKKEVSVNSAPFKFSAGQKFYMAFKRVMDFFASGLAIVILSPLLLIAAIGTKLSSKGPVLFKQIRIGKDERLFVFHKFRSMRVDAPNIPPSDMSQEQQQSYVTKWGKFIRKLSIDELPQLFDIFVGKMSFVGPRPQQDKEHERELYDLRKKYDSHAFLVRPGLCGLAIVKTNRSHDPKLKAFWDHEYVRQVGLWMDLKILFFAFGLLLGFHRESRGK